jgi:NodT family efflux transporter outer membrane factor (OMF) lipoprotein
MLGPDYREPEVEWLGSWQPDLYGQTDLAPDQARSDLAVWWRVFSDPTLEQLIVAAKRENPGLRIAGLRILESRAILGIAGSNLYPQAQQLGGAISYVNTQQHGGIAPDRNQDFIDYRTDLGIGWELDFWGRFRRGIESADAGFFASITSQQDAQVLLTAQVADLYFAYRTTLLRIGIAHENVARQKRSFDITQRIYTSGQGSELDFQQARTQYLATLSTIPDLEITLTRVRNALAALLGRPPGDLPELAGAAQPLPDLDQAAIQDIPARLLLRRPDIRTAAWQVAAQSAQIGIAEADYYPAITLLGSVGWSGNTLNATPDTGSVVAGPSFTWNIFDHGRIRNNVRLQDARLQQRIEAFQDAVLQAARELDDAAVAMIKSREQRAILREAVEAAERSLDLANTRYQEGYADFQRVLEAQRVLFSQAERELVNQGNHVSAIIALYKALGGGWSETPVEQLVPEDVRGTMRARTDWGELLTAPLPEAVDRSATVPGSSP